METVELLIYTVIVLCVGALLFAASNTVDYIKLYQSAKYKLEDSTVSSSMLVEIQTNQSFLQQAITLWHACKFGEENKSRILYFNSKGTITKDDIATLIKKYNLCDTLQHNASGCGQKDHLQMSTLQLPAIVKLACDTSRHTLVIKQ